MINRKNFGFAVKQTFAKTQLQNRRFQRRKVLIFNGFCAEIFFSFYEFRERDTIIFLVEIEDGINYILSITERKNELEIIDLSCTPCGVEDFVALLVQHCFTVAVKSSKALITCNLSNKKHWRLLKGVLKQFNYKPVENDLNCFQYEVPKRNEVLEKPRSYKQ